MIEMKNVTKVYKNGVEGIRKVTLTIENGEFVYLVGDSGSGKSTFAKLIFLEEKATNGFLKICGQDLSKMKRKEIPKFRREIGVVFQDYKLLQHLNVFDNISFALEVIGTKPEIIEELVFHALKLVNLVDKVYEYPADLSGGEQQRVAIARAVCNAPKLLIADEPTANLDPATALEIMKVLYRINLQGTTVLMITHNWKIVNTVRYRVLEMKEGKIVRDQLQEKDALTYDYKKKEYYVL